ncbi:hypothetical protein GJAV_G00120530 [Gymnothorax javanicus]|nr:hypothetical protein GJAV_G00120530 [Gymnothorax javanicus]
MKPELRRTIFPAQTETDAPKTHVHSSYNSLLGDDSKHVRHLPRHYDPSAFKETSGPKPCQENERKHLHSLCFLTHLFRIFFFNVTCLYTVYKPTEDVCIR